MISGHFAELFGFLQSPLRQSVDNKLHVGKFATKAQNASAIWFVKLVSLIAGDSSLQT